jgi:hypothetical protein
MRDPDSPHPAELPQQPESQRLVLASSSRAADAGYLALADLAGIATELSVEYRIVGGHMVTLLVAAHGVSGRVPMRETVDADFAALPEVIADPRLPDALHARGYTQREASNRFVRRHDDAGSSFDLVVDILAPSYQGKLLSNQQHGHLVVDEIPGADLSLARPPMLVDLQVRLTGGATMNMRLALPDVSAATCMKALAYRGRFADKDAVDLLRLLTTAYEVGLTVENWPTGVIGRDAGEALHRFFGRPSAAGLGQASMQPSDRARMRALVQAVVARPGA